MSEINWGLAGGPTSFDNALAKGFQIGGQLRQRREEKEYKNALAQYDPANPDTIKPVMQANPQVGIQLQRQSMQDAEHQQELAANQRKQYQDQMGTMRKLLMHAKNNPEQAIAAAQQMGIDTTKIPDPASADFQPWVDQQLFTAEALAKADPDELKGIAYELQQAGYKPGTPEFEQAARSVISNKYASEYVDENGNTRRRSALNLGGAQGGVAYDPNEWEVVEPQGGQPAQGSAPFAQAFQDMSRPLG